MAVVPNLSRQLVSSNEILKLLFVLCSLKKKPVCYRITNSVAENDVQSKGDFIDEVVHVSFQTAVVVAAKDESSFVIDKDPACKMNGRHACEMTARVDVTRGVLDEPQQIHEQPAAE